MAPKALRGRGAAAKARAVVAARRAANQKRDARRTALTESREAFTARLKKICEDINESLDVEGLCRDLLPRIEKLVARKGDRLAE